MFKNVEVTKMEGRKKRRDETAVGRKWKMPWHRGNKKQVSTFWRKESILRILEDTDRGADKNLS